ncbi:hypothetical protein AMECASPLE_013787 [Ameca splendens]|uniref:Uncharacterized protein n=1 Tax=Ameca splendens TaxID=208324 RepID=A0ABV0ZB18_9TELE
MDSYCHDGPFISEMDCRNHLEERCSSDQLVSAIALQQEDPSSNPGLGSFCIEIAWSPGTCVGSLWVLQLPSSVQKHDCLVNGSP